MRGWLVTPTLILGRLARTLAMPARAKEFRKRRLAPLRPLSLAAAVASLGWSMIPGCFSDGTEYRTVVESIEVRQILFPDSVPVGQADSLVVLALVGYTGCFPGEVSLARSGDSLVVSGTFTCPYRTNAIADPGGVRIATPPATPIETRAVLRLPDLEAGMSFIVAEGWSGAQLLDTLVVTSQGPVARHERLVGFGYVYEHSVSGCTVFPVACDNDAYERSLDQRYLVDSPLVPFSTTSVEINATIVGPASCDSSFAGVLRLRNLTPRE